MADSPDEPVPKLPRGRGLKFSGPELFRIAITLSLLVAIVMLARPCANAVSHFVMGFGSGSAAGSATPKPNTTGQKFDPDDYEHMRPGMTDAELKAAIERAKRKAAGGSDRPIAPPSPSDSGATPSAAGGSATIR